MKRLSLWIIALSFLSCSGGQPKELMTEQQMVDFLSEAYLIEGFYAIETGYHYESLSDEIIASYQRLLSEQGLTQEQFEKSMDYYMHHSDRYDAIHQQVVERLDAAMPEEVEKSQHEKKILPQKLLSPEKILKR